MEENRTTTRVSSLFTTSCSPDSLLLLLPFAITHQTRGGQRRSLKKESGKGEMSKVEKKRESEPKRT
jgi:hypothetical protein